MKSKAGNEVVVPETNLDAFCLLYCIETALRELIIKKLTEIKGPSWYKERLPGDVLDKYKRAWQVERQSKWTDTIPHHPIYYLDFTDLSKIIARTDNWREAFVNIFGNKAIFQSTLSEIEVIRNKVAHNRKVTTADVRVLTGAYAKIEDCVGKQHFKDLSARCTFLRELPERIADLRREAQLAFEQCENCKELPDLSIRNAVSSGWWFNDEYLGHSIDEVNKYYSLLCEYAKLPKGRGTGHKTEKWLSVVDLRSQHERADKQLTAIQEAVS